MSEFFPKIKKEFRTYESFRKRKKRTNGTVLLLDEEKPKSGQKPRLRCAGELRVESGLTKCECKIHADVSIINRKSYSARIFADYFGEKPCLRFCSTGRYHMNREIGRGLPDRAVPTPHFHKVDSCGIMRAYQTGALAKNEKLIEDVKSGINLFCQESNVVSPDGTPVVVKINAQDLGLSMDDPSQSINFYP
jgi:hypothetical protein